MEDILGMEGLLLVFEAVVIVLFVVEAVRMLRHRHFSWGKAIYVMVLCVVMIGIAHLCCYIFPSSLPELTGGGKIAKVGFAMMLSDLMYVVAIVATLAAAAGIVVQSFVRRRNKFPRRVVALLLLLFAILSVCVRFVFLI